MTLELWRHGEPDGIDVVGAAVDPVLQAAVMAKGSPILSAPWSTKAVIR